MAVAGTLAAAAAASGRTAVRLRWAPDPSTAGQRVKITGRTPGARRVTLWRRAALARRFRRVAATRTGVGGRFVFFASPDTNRRWFVTARGVRSRTVYQPVRARITLTATVAAGSSVRLSGHVTPSHSGERVLLQQHAFVGRWRAVARARLNRGSSFSAVVQLPEGVKVRALFGGDRRNARSLSLPVAITEPTVIAELGTPRALPGGFFGVDWDYSGAALFSGNLAGEYSDLRALSPGTLRWPDGTAANYFQWQLGYPTDIGERDGFKYTLEDLAAAYRTTGALPVFDLNVMTASLKNQEQMLRTAQRLGIPIRYLELGNEFYLSNPAYIQSFPTATAYGQTVAEYVTALHHDFPGALVAAVGSFSSATLREQTWNSDMLTAAQAAGGLPDAITLHGKPRADTPVTAGGLPRLFAEPYAVVSQDNKVLAALPDPEPAWLTEYNLQPDTASNPAQQVYAHALVVAEQALLTQEVSTATLADYWTSLQGSANGAYSPSVSGTPTLTPAGLALKWIQNGASGATQTTPIIFAGGQALSPGGPPELVGYQFSTGRAVLVNLSGRAIEAVAGNAIPVGQRYQQVAADPTQTVLYASQLGVTSGTVGQALTLPPYSLTLVG